MQITEELLARYVAQETNDTENQAIERWRADLPAHEKMIQDFEKLWTKTEVLKSSFPSFDTEKAWAKFDLAIQNDEKGKIRKITFKPTALRIAASVLLIATVGFAIYWLSGRQDAPEVMAQITKTQKEAPNLTLEDKSTVQMGQNAKITYPEKFAKTNRMIRFEGQAHFKISPDASRPFIIQTSEKATIKVLGTSFWVTSYPETDRVEVNVTTGKVEVSAKEQKIVLEAGESGVWAGKKGDLAKIDTRRLETEKRQKTYSLIFKGTPLPAVIEKLNITCGTKLTLSPELQKCLLTVNFEEQDVETILQILTETLEIKQTQGRQGDIVLTGKGCE